MTVTNRNLVRRVRKIEQRTFQPRWRVVVKDYDELYRGECGEGLTQVQFDAWVKQQDKDTQVIVVEVCAPEPEAASVGGAVILKVENQVDKNMSDVLKEYDEALTRAAEADLRSRTAELANARREESVQ
jgi:sulfate adenylyltransferase subunit 1 (EFTu-like GTPase family)